MIKKINLLRQHRNSLIWNFPSFLNKKTVKIFSLISNYHDMHSKITQLLISYLIPVLSLQKQRYLMRLMYLIFLLFYYFIFSFFHIFLRNIARNVVSISPEREKQCLRIVWYIIEVQVYNCTNEPTFRARETSAPFTTSPWCDAQTVGEPTECSRKRHPPNIYWNGQTNNLHTCSADFSKILLETISLRSPPALPPRW